MNNTRNQTGKIRTMYDLRFFRTRLGQAAMVSVAAMVTFIAFQGQAPANPPAPPISGFAQVELA